MANLKEIITVEDFEVTIKRDGNGYIAEVPELPGCSMSFKKDEKDKIPSTMREIIVERIKLAAEDLKRFPKRKPGNGKGPDQGSGEKRRMK
jgi:hypothetical protein